MCPHAYAESMNRHCDIASVLPAARHALHERPGIIAAGSQTSVFAKVPSLPVHGHPTACRLRAGQSTKVVFGFFVIFFLYSYLINNELRLVGGTWPCLDIDIKQRFTPHHHVSWTCLRVVSASACARRGTTDAGHPSCWEAFQHD